MSLSWLHAVQVILTVTQVFVVYSSSHSQFLLRIPQPRWAILNYTGCVFRNPGELCSIILAVYSATQVSDTQLYWLCIPQPRWAILNCTGCVFRNPGELCSIVLAVYSETQVSDAQCTGCVFRNPDEQRSIVLNHFTESASVHLCFCGTVITSFIHCDVNCFVMIYGYLFWLCALFCCSLSSASWDVFCPWADLFIRLHICVKLQASKPALTSYANIQPRESRLLIDSRQTTQREQIACRQLRVDWQRAHIL